MENETGCKLRALLLKYHIYQDFLKENINENIDLIVDIIQQEMSDRNYLQYCLINAINVTIGGADWIDFKDTIQKQNVIVKIDKKEVEKLKEKQKEILNKLL